MNWLVRVAKRARKELKRFPKKDAQRILTTIEEMAADPYRGDVEKMEGHDIAWRRRVGAYRIFYEVNKKAKLVDVFRIERRTSSTY